jgi:hypothetical protein
MPHSPKDLGESLSLIGRASQDMLREAIISFHNLELSGEERVWAIAGAVAGTAVSRYRRCIGRYLDAVKIWGIMVALDAASRPPRLDGPPSPLLVGAAIAQLLTDADDIQDVMIAAGTPIRARMAVELMLFAQLIGRYDVKTIYLALHAITVATALEDFEVGQLIEVPLHTVRAAIRTDRLEALAACGTA